MKIRQKIGQRVRDVRNSLGWTQTELGDRAGLGTETISRIERGVQGVTFENIKAIADAVGIPFAEFVDVEAEHRSIHENVQSQEIIELLERASPYEVELVYKMVHTILDWSEQGDPEE